MVKRGRGPLPPRTTMAAAFLTLAGLVFGFIGLGVLMEEGVNASIAFFVMSGIGLIPGLFNLVILIRAYLGHKGYHYNMVPSYDS